MHNIIKRFAVLVVGLGLAFPAMAAEPQWQSFDDLPLGDHQLAETALNEMFGEDVELRPDWIDPSAVVIPVGRDGNNLLVVRYPMRLACGAYGFVVFGTVEDGQRARLGDYFCGSELTVYPGQPLPDLEFSGEGVQAESGDWDYQSIRWRWVGNGWGRVLVK